MENLRERTIRKIESVIVELEGWELIQVNNLFCQEANYYVNEIFDFSDPEDFFETFFNGDLVGAIQRCIFGDVNWSDNFIYFNGYGNLITTNYPEYSESSYVIAETIFENPESFEGIASELDEILETIKL